MDYIQVKIEIAPFNEDMAECLIADLAEIGFESFTTEEPFLNSYIQQEQFSQTNLKCLLSGYSSWENTQIQYTTELIKEQNWNAVWESGFDPIIIEEMVTVKAPFHNIPETKYNIIIEPKMAFGTGHHQTTSLMLKSLLLLNEEIKLNESPDKLMGSSIKGKHVLDMGCGTGVLAFLAAKMGALSPVHGIDVDLTSVNSAQENAQKNKLEGDTRILYGDASLIQRGKYDIILANINRNVLLEDMQTYFNGLKIEGGNLIVSGFYVADAPMLIKRAFECGFEKLEELHKDDWCAIIFKKNKK